MMVFLSGRFVPEESAMVSVFDRGFLYGDGLFETIRVYRGKPFRWARHVERLDQGAEFLRLRPPFTQAQLRAWTDELLERNQAREALLRLTLSRGVGVRGYSIQGADKPTLVMSTHAAPTLDGPTPPRWRLMLSAVRVPARDPLANFKTCNRLPQILARAEAEAAGADEALLLSTDGHVAEAAGSNLFWIAGGTVCTPPLASGVLAGVTRALVLELCTSLGLPTRERQIGPPALAQASGVFLTLSSLEIVEAITLDGTSLRQSPLVGTIRRAYRKAVQLECG